MEWTRGLVLGRGSTATVSTATSTSGERVFAVKSSDFSHSESLRKEQHFLSILKSPYVIGYKGCDITTQEKKTIYNIFIDYMSGGSIIDSINRRNGEGLTDFEIGSYTTQIVRGLDYIHSNGIVHCDIKGGNILLDQGCAKIGDFGCAKWANDQTHQASSVSGTPMFMAPEVARGEEQGFAADVWALGCTVIEMATGGGSPWPNVNDPVSVLYRIAFSGDIPGMPRQLSDQAKDFVSKCLIRDPRKRWTARQLLEHPYIQQFDETSPSSSVEKIRTDSPTSILDQHVWNSIEVRETSSFSSVGTEFTQSSSSSLSNSLRQRIEQLAGKSEMPNWRCEEGEIEWMTIRIDGGSDGKAKLGR